MESTHSINKKDAEDIEKALIRIILIEDDPNDALLMRRMLERDEPRRFLIKHCDRLSVGIDLLDSQEFDVMLLDLELPDSIGMGTIEWARKQATELPIIVLTGMEDEKFAMEALKAGAQDYLVKSKADKIDVMKAILMAMEHKQIRQLLRKKERRLELAMTAAELGIWDWDITSNNIILDDRSVDFLGFSEGDNTQPIVSLLKFVHPDDLDQTAKCFQDHLLGQTPSCETDLRIKNHAGNWRWISVHGKIVEHDENGGPIRATGVYRDITESKKDFEKSH